VTPDAQLLPDKEECRRFGAYEASSAREYAAAGKLLNLLHGFSDLAYMKLLGDLRAIRVECNEDMLAIIAPVKRNKNS
jgi:hypothetical protein